MYLFHVFSEESVISAPSKVFIIHLLACIPGTSCSSSVGGVTTSCSSQVLIPLRVFRNINKRVKEVDQLPIEVGQS